MSFPGSVPGPVPPNPSAPHRLCAPLQPFGAGQARRGVSAPARPGKSDTGPGSAARAAVEFCTTYIFIFFVSFVIPPLGKGECPAGCPPPPSPLQTGAGWPRWWPTMRRSCPSASSRCPPPPRAPLPWRTPPNDPPGGRGQPALRSDPDPVYFGNVPKCTPHPVVQFAHRLGLGEG